VSTVPDVLELAGHAVAMVVATRDDELRPAISRGWAPKLSADGNTLMLCVHAPAGSATAANLVAGAQIAVTMSRPSTYATVQLKGRVSVVAPLDDTDRRRVATHVAAFVDETSAAGLSPGAAAQLARGELVTVVVDVLERYDQTPGAGAGKAL